MRKIEIGRSLLGFTARIVSAHVAHNPLPVQGLLTLIRHVYDALANAGTVPTEPERRLPAVPIRRSVMADYIICLEDGRKLKMLKRHLQTAYNMTPAAYRERWGLPQDYPMVAPSYAQRRSTLAKEIGLGRRQPPVHEPAPKSAMAQRQRTQKPR